MNTDGRGVNKLMRVRRVLLDSKAIRESGAAANFEE
jgi:hypothetical protein